MFTYLVFFTYFYTDLDEIFGCKNEKKKKVRWNAKGPPFTTGLGVWASRKEGRERAARGCFTTTVSEVGLHLLILSRVRSGPRVGDT